MQSTVVDTGDKLFAATSTTQPRLRPLAEQYQNEFLFSQVFALEDSPYQTVSNILSIHDAKTLDNDEQTKAHRDGFAQHNAVIVGWDNSIEPRALVIAVKATDDQSELRKCWPDLKQQNDPTAAVGGIFAKLQEIKAIQREDGEGIDGDKIRVILVEEFDWIELQNVILKSGKRSQQIVTAHEPSNSPVRDLFHNIVSTAIKGKASDIHIFPNGKIFQVAYRIDGELAEDPRTINFALGTSLIAHVKNAADMKSDEKRLPQSKKYQIPKGELKGHQVDGDIMLRIESLPCDSIFTNQQNETLTIRVQSNENPNMYDLGNNRGYTKEQLKLIRARLDEPDGLIILTGPTGSGKTTTLYSCMKHLNTGRYRLFSVEDPIEARFARITQVQVNEGNANAEKDLTFSRVLRSFLRSDPDVIMVGEIRDNETARVAVKAVSTGHQVLTTLHTNGVIETIERLRELEISPTQLASAFRMAISQRLLRVFNRGQDNIRNLEIYDGRDQLNALIGQDLIKDPIELTRPRHGVAGHIAFKGRVTISEIWAPGKKTSKLLRDKAADTEDLRASALAEDGFEPMLYHGLRQVFAGNSSVEELCRILGADQFSDQPEIVVRAARDFGRKPAK